MPFGISLATAVCNRLITHILEKCNKQFTDTPFVSSFVDDIVIHSDNFETHIKHINIVLTELAKSGLTIKKSKCSFSCNSLNLLGFVIGNGKLSPDPAKTVALRNFPEPILKKDMRSFIGLLNFYRRFIPNLASKIAPLTETLCKIAPNVIVWTEKLRKTFTEVKEEFVGVVELHIPLRGASFLLQTDACDNGVAAVLSQNVDNTEFPICFISRKLNHAEKGYSIIEKECLAIVWAVRKLHQYLYGKPFKIKTDHAPLQWLSSNKDVCSKRMRWSLALQPYSFTIEYIKGKENTVPDVLSRYIGDHAVN